MSKIVETKKPVQRIASAETSNGTASKKAPTYTLNTKSSKTKGFTKEGGGNSI